MKKIKMLNLCVYIFFLINLFNIAYSEIYIVLKIKDNIITNYDIKKESSYLKILNKSLNEINDDKINNLAKKSLIDQTIKKEEISKFIDIQKEDIDTDISLENLLKNLNIANLNDFQNLLKTEKTYNLDEIKNKIKIETLWNILIYEKFKNKINVDEKKILTRLESFENKNIKEFLLSEIVFRKTDNKSLEKLIAEINSSIQQIGFENTANIFSITDSAKLGGVIGWVSENNLVEPIINELKKINEGEYTNVIKINNNFIILKINKIKVSTAKIDKDKEFKKIVENEKNIQLTKFSRIYFDKAYMNYIINEE
jgi:peptidyl-prolyl cis-trans isomerase SurA